MPGVWLLPVRDCLERLAAWLEELGYRGPVLLAVVSLVVRVRGLPGTSFTWAGAYSPGLLRTVVAVAVGLTLGATAVSSQQPWAQLLRC